VVAARRQHGWERYAAPAAFLAVATIAIVLVASALHGPQTAQDRPGTSVAKPVARTTSTARAKTTKGPKGHRLYTVVAGDTFGVIAAKTGTTVADLERLNPGVSSTSLHIGQKLKVT
jgi:LysM repeat protein